jgi:DNA-binding NarL/FixJ family response regulator
MASAAPDPTDGRGAGPIDVFVADDEEAVVDVLRAVIATDPTLRFAGAAHDADAAIAEVARTKPDVALVDVRMPGGGGVHAAREIRRRDLPTKVIALSAHEDADTVISMLGVGAHAYVPKADPTDKIVGTIHRVVDPDWREEDGRERRPPILAPPLPRRSERGPRVARAILEGAVTAGFEPVIDVVSGGIVGLDARPVVRMWPERAYDGWLADAAAEDLLIDFEMTAFRAALPFLARFPEELFVEFQVTPAAAAHPRFRHAVVAAGPRRIVLGFSSLAIPRDDTSDGLPTAVARLRAYGVRISARDVGPGVEGLRQLARLQPDHAWLDPTISKGLGTSFPLHSVAATVVACADQVGARVIADGVGTRAQLDEAEALGISMAAGAFLGGPLGAPEPDEDGPAASTHPLPRGSSSGPRGADASLEDGSAEPRSDDRR